MTMLGANIPPEILQRARQLVKDGVFDRKVVSVTPVNFFMDRVTFECGHVDKLASYAGPYVTHHCNTCLAEWMQQEAER